MVYILALLAGSLYGIHGLINKRVTNLVNNPILSSLIFNIVSVFGSILLLSYDYFNGGIYFSNNFYDWLFLFVSALLTVFAFWGLFSALRELPVSTHILLSRASLLTYTVGGFLIFGDVVTGLKLLGLLFVLIGIFLSSVRKGEFVFNKWALVQLASSVGFGLTVLIDKKVSGNFGVGSYVFANVALTTLALFIWAYKAKVLKEINFVPKEYIKVTSISAFFAILAYFFVILSYDFGGNVVIVGAISQIKLPIAVLGGYFFFNERTDLLTKFLGVITVVAGVLLLRL